LVTRFAARFVHFSGLGGVAIYPQGGANWRGAAPSYTNHYISLWPGVIFWTSPQFKLPGLRLLGVDTLPCPDCPKPGDEPIPDPEKPEEKSGDLVAPVVAAVAAVPAAIAAAPAPGGAAAGAATAETAALSGTAAALAWTAVAVAVVVMVTLIILIELQTPPTIEVADPKRLHPPQPIPVGPTMPTGGEKTGNGSGVGLSA